MTSEIIINFGVSDLFYNPTAVFIAVFILFFAIYFFILMKTPLGKRENKGIVIIISLIAALFTVYGLFLRDYGFFELPQFNFFSRFFQAIGNFFSYFGVLGRLFADFFYFLSGLGILGIFILIGVLYVLYLLVKAFVRFVKINFGYGQ